MMTLLMLKPLLETGESLSTLGSASAQGSL